ncbi:MAG: murein biosynthesis integral membrane protein MurJ [Synergistaceae bacterium]|nr:murein biosynthesis integral membrane protein MurJ [Synergistaceae bacterium]
MSRNDNLPGMVRHAMRMMVGTLASRVLGLVREMLTAALFGATRQLDAFYVAYTLANLSRQLLAEGALSASFVPVFSRTLENKGKDSAQSLAKQALSVLLLGGALVVTIGIIFAPVFVGIMAPGFAAEERTLAISLTRIMFPFLLFVSVGALAMGVLNSMGSFFVPAVAPALSNIAYILFLIATMKNLTIWNLSAAVLIGGICHMLLQWYWCGKMGVMLTPALPKRDNAELKSMMYLFFPYAAGLSLNQVNPVISRIFGSFLTGGSISVLTYADRVLQLPLGLFVIAISQAVLPMLSRQDPNDRAGFRDFIRDALRFDLFVILPVSVGIFVLSQETVHILFFRGAFTEWAWHATGTALAIYGLGLPGMASSTVILRAMYARRMPRGAVGVTGVTVAVNLAACLLLMPLFKYAGLAGATAAAFTCSSLYGAWALSKNLKEPLGVFDFRWLTKILSSTALMFAVLYAIKTTLPYPLSASVGLRALWLTGMVIVGAATYSVSTMLFRCSEWQWIKDALKQKRN